LQKKIKFGIIGCSWIGESSTIPAIRESKFSEIHMIGSRSEKKAKDFAKKFDCKLYGNYDDILENRKVQAVYISLPVGLHKEWSIKAAKAGKHILCEKSSATSFIDAKRMVKQAKENNVRLMEGFMFRFHPSHTKVHELIKKGYIGKLFTFYGNYGFPPIDHNNIRYKKNLGGGILNDSGCYPICASRIIFNKEPTGVLCNSIIDQKSGVDTKTTIFLKFNEKQFAHMATGYGLFYQSMYDIWGSEGRLRLSRAYNIPPYMKASIIIESNKIKKNILIPPNNHFKLMIDNFSQEILGKKFCNFNFEEDLLKQAKVMDAARKSHKEQRYINIK